MELQTLNDDISYHPSLVPDIDLAPAPTGGVGTPRPFAQASFLNTNDAARFLNDLFGDYEGTGGTLRQVYTVDLVGFTGSCLVIVRPHARDIGLTESPILSVSDQVATIKAAFGLSISQLAGLLSVQRPTIYAWLNLDGPSEALRVANRTRLQALHNLAQTWNQLSEQPLKEHLTSFQVDGDTLLDMLSQQVLDAPRIRAALTEVSKRVKETAEQDTFAVRLRSRGFAEIPSQGSKARKMGKTYKT